MPFDANPALTTPEDDTRLWRYMDFARFVQMLESQQLWFSRADQFEDPFEGTFTDGEWKVMTTPPLADGSTIRVDRSFVNIMAFMRYSCFLSCWRRGDFESLAMWDLYGRGSGIVAVTTTVGRLKKEFENETRAIHIGTVKYIDWNSAPFDNNALAMMMRKDWSYSHESEVRAFFMDSDVIGRATSEAVAGGDLAVWNEKFRSVAPAGHGLRVNLNSLVEHVWIGPREKGWVAPLVQGVLNRYGLGIPIMISDRLVGLPGLNCASGVERNWTRRAYGTKEEVSA